MRTVRRVPGMAAVFCALTACGGGGSSPAPNLPPAAPALLISGITALEFPGDTRALAAEFRDADGNTVPGVSIDWQTSDASVATIDAAGLVTAHAFGSAVISAAANGVTTTVDFDVLGDRFFLNGDVRLRYELDLPDQSGGPFPAVIWVHGSGMLTRTSQRIGTDPLVPEGLAAFRYDKRGVGESTGSFFGIGPANANLGFGLLASDAVAAARFLGNFPEIDPQRIGIMANSQGGWIAPLAASQSDIISFLMIWSGPTVSVGLEIFYSMLAEGTGTSLDDVYAQLDSFAGPHGHDPLAVLMGLDIPSLWLFGEIDRSIPTRLDVENMQQLQALGLPYEFIVYPFAGHDLRDTRTGQFVDLWTDYANWLRDQGILPPS